MSLRKQCNEDTVVDRFANDYLSFLQQEIGYASWMPRAKVLECDEREWADLYRLYARTSGHETDAESARVRSHWLRTQDAYSIPAVVRYPTGEARRSTEVERLEKLIKSGAPGDLASLIARFDAVTFLRKSRFQRESPQ
jgi:hypothetical protein